IGYLAAFSGSLSDKSLTEKFVPPICDIHAQHSFFKVEEQALNALNRQIEALENATGFIMAQEAVKSKTRAVEQELKARRLAMKQAKLDRKAKRAEAKKHLDEVDFLHLHQQLAEESIAAQLQYKRRARSLRAALAQEQAKLDAFTANIIRLKKERKQKSALLQQKIFDRYQFLNQRKEAKKLSDIFSNSPTQQPPSGAGDCSAPKLLQYAFQHDLKPIAMGEFWWGIAPKAEVRKHKHFYPACNGRCKPILAHMLQGIEMDDNPFLKNSSKHLSLEIIFEDEAILLVNKPAEFLSVPGKKITDSVYTRMKALFPHATGPLLVHRLDMSTSGILLLAKTKAAHQFLQHQFIHRSIKKRYTALLDGIIEGETGYIDLPLRVDLNDRPRQLVCYDHGKAAKTRWEVIKRNANTTKVHFYPITGRTHQLRVHAAHPLGMNTPIVGDDLYGKKDNRLHLHAAFLEFLHPASKERVSFELEVDF
ncbi:MAG: pseudouridine synthase, partial [Bacteroidota bacterium]